MAAVSLDMGADGAKHHGSDGNRAKAARAVGDAPLAFAGAALALIGAITASQADSSWARVAAIVAGTVLIALHYLGPRLHSVKWRDTELLLNAAGEAESKGDEESSEVLLRAAVDVASAPDKGRDEVRHAPRWLFRRQASNYAWVPRSFDFRQYERMVRDTIARLVPADTVVVEVTSKPYDLEVTRQGQTLAVDVRYGLGFRTTDVVARLLADHAMRTDERRPIAYLVVVNADPSDEQLKEMERVVSAATLPFRLQLATLPTPDSLAGPDTDDLELALSTLLNY